LLGKRAIWSAQSCSTSAEAFHSATFEQKRAGILSTLCFAWKLVLHEFAIRRVALYCRPMSNGNDPQLGDSAAPPQPSDSDEPTVARRYWLMVRAHPRAFASSLVTLALPFFIGLALDLNGTRTVPRDFMEISCQVMAVLILALALQTRLLSIARFEKPDDRMDTIVVAGILFYGEIAPLAALLCGTNSVILAIPAAYALLFSLVLILAYAVFGEPRSPDPGVAAVRGSTTLDGDDLSKGVSVRWL
jgi:hypothetical protein